MVKYEVDIRVNAEDIPDFYGFASLAESMCAEVHRHMDSMMANVIGERREGCAWLQELEELCASGKLDKSIDLVTYSFDALLRSKLVELLDRILALANVDKLSVDALLAMLSESARASEQLPSRARLYARVEAKLVRDGTQDRERLLRGLH